MDNVATHVNTDTVTYLPNGIKTLIGSQAVLFGKNLKGLAADQITFFPIDSCTNQETALGL